jgi:hypothetical protein
MGFGRRSVFLGLPLPRFIGLVSVLGKGGFGLGTGCAVMTLGFDVAGLGGGGILVRCRLSCFSSLVSPVSASAASLSDSSSSDTTSTDDRFLVPKMDVIGGGWGFLCGFGDGTGDGLTDGGCGSSSGKSSPSAGGKSSINS